ncbi:protein phosphatase 1 regulatory subunit 16A-like isoform X1 [Centruroides vittatus]|uniref:protein phosphatase 1 regulatory subunit 16A-like isoform X3 n=1 Tax=Centruroides sculpturatus TaxID=218467 RepID=UPI000C6E155E|nr:protein phosphatase 1 regulatory subunit 16A-like isoform X3 [Centruroides sculpturatus]
MAEHSELVAELAMLERMTTQERLKHARKRRMQQLKKWNQKEKENNSKRKKTEHNLNRKSRRNGYKVHFVPSVMLLEAAARNDVEEVHRLLTLGVNPDSTNEDGLTALHQCCIDDSEDMMKLLLEFGANVNTKDSEQWTPLHAAATCGHLHLVKYLISKGADLLAVNADGNMPYDICEDDATLDYIESEMAKRGVTQEMIDQTRASTERRMLEDLEWIVENGGDIEYKDNQGATPLHVAAANGYLSVVEYLLENNVSTEVVDDDLWQPIHAAACWGHPDVIELLVQFGADLNAKTKNGESPYDICEDLELKERILQLKSEMETNDGTPRHKLRRTHSQNTRSSQSIRRTSIREKTEISRREAMEEAKLWQGKQESSNNEEDDEIKQKQDCKEYEKETSNSSDLNALLSKDTLQRLKHKTMEIKDCVYGDQSDYKSKKLHSLSKIVPQNSLEPKKDHSDTQVTVTDSRLLPVDTSPSESVKVEIHVTVNTSPSYAPSPGTLADLKRHRADIRNRNSANLSSQQDLNGKITSRNGRHFSATYTYQTPPSPTTSLRKYRSDPSEIVGDPQKHGCCTLM